jgi:hypothetical protein
MLSPLNLHISNRSLALQFAKLMRLWVFRWIDKSRRIRYLPVSLQKKLFFATCISPRVQ